MEWWAFQDLLVTVAIIVGVLVPVFALTYRFVLKPVWRDRDHLPKPQESQVEVLRDVRLDNMERQLEDLDASVRRLVDLTEFDRQLKSGKPPMEEG
jgi:LPS O-antigen subunit length determinant protein (WzzB/FepE family)